MSLSSIDRRAFLLACLTVTGCGYAPILRPEASASQGATLLPIKLAAPKTGRDFAFAKHLGARLADPATSRYRLSYSIATSRDGVGLNPKQETFRYHLVGKVTYEVTDLTNGTIKLSGSVDAFTAYSVASVDRTTTPATDTAATIATRAAENDATDRLMRILGDQVYLKLLTELDLRADEA